MAERLTSDGSMEDQPLGDTTSTGGVAELEAAEAGEPPAKMPDVPPPPVPPTSMGGVGDASSAAYGGGVKCEVIDPQTHGEGRQRFTDYCVLIPNVSAVRRRYSDFQWLYNRMHVERPGSIVPIIPHKRVGLIKNETKFSHEFVQERRSNLEVFIRRILAHPELADTPSVVAFMKQDDELFASAKRANDFDTSLSLSTHSNGSDGTDYAVDTMAAAEAGGASVATPEKTKFPRIKRLFAKAAIATGAKLEKTEDEEVFASIDEYAAELDMQIQTLAKQAAALSKSTASTSECIREISRAFSSLSENTYPNTDLGAAGRLATVLNDVGKGMLAMAGVSEEKSHEETVQFDMLVQDFERDVQALKLALARRKEKLYTLTTKLNKISKVGDKLDRMRDDAKPGSEVQIKTQEGALLEAREAADFAKSDLEEVSDRVKSEVERFRGVVDVKLRRIVAGLGGVQLRYNTRLNEGWANLLTHVHTGEQTGQEQVQTQAQGSLVEPKIMSC